MAVRVDPHTCRHSRYGKLQLNSSSSNNNKQEIPRKNKINSTMIELSTYVTRNQEFERSHPVVLYQYNSISVSL